MTDTMAFTYSNRTVHVAGSATEFIAAAKNRKYKSLAATEIFIPLAYAIYSQRKGEITFRKNHIPQVIG